MKAKKLELPVLVFLGVLGVLGGSTSSAQTTRKFLDVTLTTEGRPEHPIVYLTKDDIARARENAKKYPWAKRAAEKIVAEADKWAAMSDEQLAGFVPPPKSCYAYGFAGCPVCGGKFASWWGAGGVARIDDPRHVRCVN